MIVIEIKISLKAIEEEIKTALDLDRIRLNIKAIQKSLKRKLNNQ